MSADPPEPHLSQLGRDPPHFRYLARLIVRRNKVKARPDLVFDLECELRAAFIAGRYATLAEFPDPDDEPDRSSFAPDSSSSRPSSRE